MSSCQLYEQASPCQPGLQTARTQTLFHIHTQMSTHTHIDSVSLSVMGSFSSATGASTVTALSVPNAHGPK